MHPLVAEHPAVVEYDRLRAEAKAKADAAEAEITQAWNDYRDAAAHAARNGAPMPLAPERSNGSIRQEQRERDQVLSNLRDQAFGENAEEMHEQMRAREQGLLDEARPMVKRLLEIADEMAELVRTTKFVTQKANRNTWPLEHPDVYSRNDVNVGVLIVAACNEWRFLGAPLAPAPSGRPAGHYGIHDDLLLPTGGEAA